MQPPYLAYDRRNDEKLNMLPLQMTAQVFFDQQELRIMEQESQVHWNNAVQSSANRWWAPAAEVVQAELWGTFPTLGLTDNSATLEGIPTHSLMSYFET